MKILIPIIFIQLFSIVSKKDMSYIKKLLILKEKNIYVKFHKINMAIKYNYIQSTI
jgi:hypothetical protein